MRRSPLPPSAPFPAPAPSPAAFHLPHRRQSSPVGASPSSGPRGARLSAMVAARAAGFTKPAPVGFFRRKKPSRKTGKTERFTGTFFPRVGWTGRNPEKPVFGASGFQNTERFFRYCESCRADLAGRPWRWPARSSFATDSISSNRPRRSPAPRARIVAVLQLHQDRAAGIHSPPPQPSR
jgi:hypothetical protein